MPYHPDNDRRPGDRCCYKCDNSDFCPWGKINNQKNQLRNLQYALERKNTEIWQMQLDHNCKEIIFHLTSPYSGWVSPSDHKQEIETISNLKSLEIEKLKSELEETKKTLQNVLNENPYKEELDEIKSCKICMEKFDDGEKAAVKLQCPHIFCEKCVKKIQEQRCAKFSYQKYPLRPFLAFLKFY